VIASSPDLILHETDIISVVTLARAGDDHAYEELVRRFQPFIRNLLVRLCYDRGIADDLAQEVFLQAWQTLAKLNEPAAFPGWLRQIAINKWLKIHHRNSNFIVREKNEALYVDGRPQAADKMIDFDNALSKLSPHERLCVTLAYSEGMSHSQIATTTGWPLGTVKSHILRGCARLREMLATYRN
jgi:RNA polymerase sigma-70 factor (ECF subfamily)